MKKYLALSVIAASFLLIVLAHTYTNYIFRFQNVSVVFASL